MRGFDDDDFREVGKIIVEALGPDADLAALGARTAALCERRPLYPGFRGYTAFLASGEKEAKEDGSMIEKTSPSVGSVTGTVTEVTHPLVLHKLGLLRDVTTPTQMFRQLVNELTLLLTYEATKGLADEEIEIETPLEQTTARRMLGGKKVAICADRHARRHRDAGWRARRSCRAPVSGSSGCTATDETLRPSSTTSSSRANR